MRTRINRSNQYEHIGHAVPGQNGKNSNTVLKQASGETQAEKTVRKGLVFLGVLILAYVYSHSLAAQQAAKQRISISQAVNFPNDI
jgi:hypothetical protein